MLAELQKDRDKREGHAQERKELRVAYINRIYEAEKRQVHDEFEVRLHARFFLRETRHFPLSARFCRGAQAEQQKHKSELLAGIREKILLLQQGSAGPSRPKPISPIVAQRFWLRRKLGGASRGRTGP